MKPPMRFSVIAIPSLVLLAAAWRFVSLSAASIATADLPRDEICSAVAGTRQSSSELARYGIKSIEYQEFDPDALVAVRPGPDGLPGIANTDDNRNGVTDDRLELGATRSDDSCSVLTAEDLDHIPVDSVLVLQRGAYVSVASEQVGESKQTRAIILGNSNDGSLWSMLIDLDK